MGVGCVVKRRRRERRVERGREGEERGGLLDVYEVEGDMVVEVVPVVLGCVMCVCVCEYELC